MSSWAVETAGAMSRIRCPRIGVGENRGLGSGPHPKRCDPDAEVVIELGQLDILPSAAEAEHATARNAG